MLCSHLFLISKTSTKCLIKFLWWYVNSQQEPKADCRLSQQGVVIEDTIKLLSPYLAYGRSWLNAMETKWLTPHGSLLTVQGFSELLQWSCNILMCSYYRNSCSRHTYGKLLNLSRTFVMIAIAVTRLAI